MDEDVTKEFKSVAEVLVVLIKGVTELQENQHQHADTINQNRDRSIKSFKDIDNTIKAMQEDLDIIFDMLHDLKNLPNILSVLQDFDKLGKKDEKSTTD